MDLRTPGIFCLGLLVFCVFGDACTGSVDIFWLVYPVLPTLSSSCGGSRVFEVSSGVIGFLGGLMTRSKSGIDYGVVTSLS